MSGFVRLDNDDLHLHGSRMGAAGFQLYTVLRSFTGKTNTCYPNFKQLCEATGYDNKKVIRVLGWLEKTGYVSVERGVRGERNRYTVHQLSDVEWDDRLPPIQGGRGVNGRAATSCKTPPVLAAKRHQQADQNATSTSSNMPPELVAKRHQSYIVKEEPIKKIKDSPPSAALLFEAFWQAYPPRNGKKALKKSALEWWTRHHVTDETAGLIMAGLEKQKPLWAQDGNKYVPDAIRFLRNERWKDEIVPAPEIDMSKFQTKRLSDEIQTCSPEELAEARKAAREAFRGVTRPSATAEFRNGTSRPGFDVDREAGNREGGGYTPSLRLLPASTS